MKSSRSYTQRRKVINAARGRWPAIISALAPELREAISQQPKHVPCPVHRSVHGDGLRAFDDFPETGGLICNTCGAFPDGIAVVEWIRDCNSHQAMQAIVRALRTPEVRSCRVSGSEAADVQSSGETNSWAKAMIGQIVGEAISLTHARARPAREYLRNRGLSITDYSDFLRYHPNLPYYDSNRRLVGHYPALIAEIWDETEEEVLSLHRTYLTKDGFKAPVSEPKKLCSPVRKGALTGTAIRLFDPDERLYVAEGIETALAVYEATEVPVWSTITAGGMESLAVPDHVREIGIWADLDRSGRGEQAAETLARRLLKGGRKVGIHLPRGPIPSGRKSKDWLDVLLEGEKS